MYELRRLIMNCGIGREGMIIGNELGERGGIRD